METKTIRRDNSQKNRNSSSHIYRTTYMPPRSGRHGPQRKARREGLELFDEFPLYRTHALGLVAWLELLGEGAG